MIITEINIGAGITHTSELNKWLVNNIGQSIDWQTSVTVKGYLGSNHCDVYHLNGFDVMKLTRAMGSLSTYRIFAKGDADKYIQEWRVGEKDPETGRHRK